MSADIASGYYKATLADTEWALEFGDLSDRQGIIDHGKEDLEQGIHPAVVLARMSLAADIGVARSVLAHTRPDFNFGCLDTLIPGRKARIDYKPPQLAVVYKAESAETQISASISAYLQTDLIEPVHTFVQTEASREVRESPFAERLAGIHQDSKEVVAQVSEPLDSARKYVGLYNSSSFYGDIAGALGSGVTLLSTYTSELQPCTAIQLGGERSNRSEQTGAFNTIRFAHINNVVNSLLESSELAARNLVSEIPRKLQGKLLRPFVPEAPSGLRIIALDERDKTFDDSVTQRSVIGFSLRSLAHLCDFHLERLEDDAIEEYPATRGLGASASVFLPIEKINPMQREHLANVGYLTAWTWAKPDIQEALDIVAH